MSDPMSGHTRPDVEPDVMGQPPCGTPSCRAPCRVDTNPTSDPMWGQTLCRTPCRVLTGHFPARGNQVQISSKSVISGSSGMYQISMQLFSSCLRMHKDLFCHKLLVVVAVVDYLMVVTVH